MKIALAADLHFGSVADGLAPELAAAMESEAPDVIVIAGDLTLRARKSEFEEARVWLSSLKRPALVLPGNHDLPYWNLIQRFRNPFRRYRAAASSNLMPAFECERGMVLGFNTARPWQPHLRWQEGAARFRDIDAAKEALCAVPPNRFKAVAAHHPLARVPGFPRAEPVRRAAPALKAFAGCGVDLVMSGHIHQSYAIEADLGGRRMVMVGAPTALSTRLRGETNGFWIIEARAAAIECCLWLRHGARFQPASKKVFARNRRDA
jgi:3',5'-cyclic AMP phosphodiesterase CpdA